MNFFRNIRLSFPIHPFLITIFPILFFYSNNIEEVFLDVLPNLLLLSLLFTIFSFITLRFLLKNTIKAGLILSLFLSLLFSFGHIKTFTSAPSEIILFIWILIFVGDTYLLIITKKKLDSLNSFLNITSILLVSFSLVNIIYFEVSTNRVARLFESKEKSTVVSEIKLTKPEKPPDIYYMIFDRYSSPKTIEESYGYDIIDFTKFLTDRGFYLAKESRANYPRTFLSLGSSLNMEYVNYLADKIGEDSNDETAAYFLLQDHKVGQLLNSQGYKYIHIGGWWEPTRKNENADQNFFYSPFRFKGLDLDEFSTKFIETTLLSQFLTKTSPEGVSEPLYSRNNHREGVLFQFEALNNVAEEIKGPKFVFAHFLVPHFPYVLDENCRPITNQVAKSRSNKENYLAQLTCTNKKIKSAVNKILKESGKSAVIILQSDEGPDPINGRLEKQWQNSDSSSVKEKTSILNAYYLPGKNTKTLYPSITPVNSFRIIFNLYFGADFDLLEDKIYMIENKESPYNFFDITEKVKNS